jgi:hypothetical protein
MRVTRVSTPGLFSHSCVGCHLRKQFDTAAKLVMSIFNDDGGFVYEEDGEQAGYCEGGDVNGQERRVGHVNGEGGKVGGEVDGEVGLI